MIPTVPLSYVGLDHAVDQIVDLRRLASRVWCEVGLDAPALYFYEQSEVNA